MFDPVRLIEIIQELGGQLEVALATLDLFEMVAGTRMHTRYFQAGGLAEVPNPSALFLAERPLDAPGSAVAAVPAAGPVVPVAATTAALTGCAPRATRPSRSATRGVPRAAVAGDTRAST